jgi:hypothetical protein
MGVQGRRGVEGTVSSPKRATIPPSAALHLPASQSPTQGPAVPPKLEPTMHAPHGAGHLARSELDSAMRVLQALQARNS